MENNLQVTYQLKENEVSQLLKFHFTHDRKKVWLIYTALFFLLLIINWPLRLNVLTVSSIISSILIFYIFIKLLAFIQKKQFIKCNILGTTRNMEFSDDGFSLNTDIGDIFTKYEAIKKTIRNDEFIIIYISSNSFHFLPLRAFESKNDTEKLWGILQTKVSDTLSIKDTS